MDEQTRVVDYAESDFVQAITEKWDCEALLSGVFLDRDAFIAIADYGVTRYNGAGLDVEQAFTAFLDNTLPLITDYEGGSGCGDHDDSILECSGGCGCDEEECSGNCETCQTPC